MGGGVGLREVREDDLPVLFEHQHDLEASRLAAVESRQADEFRGHWTRLLADDTVVTRAIVVDGEVAGHALSFERDGCREVGYWLGREFWGRGIATRAPAAFLE